MFLLWSGLSSCDDCICEVAFERSLNFCLVLHFTSFPTWIRFCLNSVAVPLLFFSVPRVSILPIPSTRPSPTIPDVAAPQLRQLLRLQLRGTFIPSRIVFPRPSRCRRQSIYVVHYDVQVHRYLLVPNVIAFVSGLVLFFRPSSSVLSDCSEGVEAWTLETGKQTRKENRRRTQEVPIVSLSCTVPFPCVRAALACRSTVQCMDRQSQKQPRSPLRRSSPYPGDWFSQDPLPEDE